VTGAHLLALVRDGVIIGLAAALVLWIAELFRR
jgi:hypothetical protein